MSELNSIKQWHFYDKVYRRWVVLMIGTLKQFRAEMQDVGFNDLEGIIDSKGMCVELLPENTTTNQNATVIWLNGYETATLIHEITHLVMMCFSQVGVPISRENTEAFAFYTEFWFTEITKARRKFPNGISPKNAKR